MYLTSQRSGYESRSGLNFSSLSRYYIRCIKKTARITQFKNIINLLMTIPKSLHGDTVRPQQEIKEIKKKTKQNNYCVELVYRERKRIHLSYMRWCHFFPLAERQGSTHWFILHNLKTYFKQKIKPYFRYISLFCYIFSSSAIASCSS